MSENIENIGDENKFGVILCRVLQELKDISVSLNELTNYHSVKDVLSTNCAEDVNKKVEQIVFSINALQESYEHMQGEVLHLDVKRSLITLKDDMIILMDRLNKIQHPVKILSDIISKFDFQCLDKAYLTIDGIKVMLDGLEGVMETAALAETAAFRSKTQVWEQIKVLLTRLIIPIASGAVAIAGLKLYEWLLRLL